MLGTLSVALLIAASSNTPPAGTGTTAAPAQEYQIKKVCRTVEVSGSFIPRRSCVNKKVPIKKSEAGAEDSSKATGESADGSGNAASRED